MRHKTYSAARLTLGLLLGALSLVAAAVEDQSALAQRSGCLACHAGMETKTGPAFKAISEKYAGQKDAVSLLAERIVGGTGEHGVGWVKEGKATLPAMPPNGNVSPGNAKRLAEWIIAAKGVVSGPGRFVTNTIRVSGLVKQSLELSVADLRQFPPQKIGEVPVVCQSGENRGKIENLKGVLLKDILEKADVVSKDHNDVKKMAIVATASDDYKVVFSWTEVFNSSLGDSVIVFYERDGLPLGDNEGRIALISAKDTRTGPRHVNWLNGIEVRKIVD